jgi:hypothetical protein
MVDADILGYLPFHFRPPSMRWPLVVLLLELLIKLVILDVDSKGRSPRRSLRAPG